jgi:hypothetical protein
MTAIEVREYGLIAETPGGCLDSYLEARVKYPEQDIPDHFVIIEGPGHRAPIPWNDYGWYTRTGTTLEQLMEEQPNPVIAGVKVVRP